MKSAWALKADMLSLLSALDSRLIAISLGFAQSYLLLCLFYLVNIKNSSSGDLFDRLEITKVAFVSQKFSNYFILYIL